MTCPHCNYHKAFGGDGPELATCVCCGRFVAVDRTAVEQAFDRARFGLTPAEREQERQTRERLKNAQQTEGDNA